MTNKPKTVVRKANPAKTKKTATQKSDVETYRSLKTGDVTITENDRQRIALLRQALK